jgi:DNA polymerase-3 subunit epsilon
LRAYINAGRNDDELLHTIAAAAADTVWPAGPAHSPRPRDYEEPRRKVPAKITPPRPKQLPLVRQLNALSLLELLDEGAPQGASAYLELLLDALVDGDISQEEAEALGDVQNAYSLSNEEVRRAHEAFMLALARRAVDDGVITREERRELRDLAALLSVPDSLTKSVLDQAETARQARLSASLGPLPADWNLGEPLRIGDKVVFTGCDEDQRQRLEARAEELGVRVVGSVSRLTAMLVTDGSFSGGKKAKALELGTRTVHPDHFEVLLRHLQPSIRLTGQPSALPEPRLHAQTNVESRNSNQEIRAWALINGYEVGVRGRLPQAVVAAFIAQSQQAESTEGAA